MTTNQLHAALTPAQAAILKARERLATLAAADAARLAEQQQKLLANKLTPASASTSATLASIYQIDDSRPWNSEQRLAIETGLQRKSFVLTGAAGTGKTSTLKGLVNSLLKNNLLPNIPGSGATKWLQTGKPGICLVSFTNMAVRQIAKHFSNDIHCLTIHKLLEFAPVYYDVEDPSTGETRTKVSFEPSRNSIKPLPAQLTTIVIDESSMVDAALVEQLIAALPHPEQVQFILLGDINQLPPVYGGPILGRGLLTLPTVELTTIYRQALESPIISLATDIKDGKLIPVVAEQTIDAGEHGLLVIKPWSKAIAAENACNKASNFLKGAIAAKLFDVYKDMALCPYNVGFGTLEINKSIADWLGRERDATVHSIIAGFNTYYYAVGDKVLVNKREAIITKIVHNGGYAGKKPVDTRLYKLDRWGGASKIAGAKVSWEEGNEDLDADAILQSLMATSTEVADRKTSASHRVTVRFINGYDPREWLPSDEENHKLGNSPAEDYFESVELTTAAEINDMLFGYCCTVHKSQGSEWRKVILFLHQSHAAMCSRELVYTAITRAAKALYVICEPDRAMKPGTLTRAAKSPRLKGNTLAEKLVSLREKFDKEQAEFQASAEGKLLAASGGVQSPTPRWDTRFGALK